MDKWKNNLPEKEEDLLRKEILALLRRTLKPEFLNRVDEIVMFRPLSKAQIKEIVKIQLHLIEKMLADINLRIVIKESAIDWLTEKGYDPQLGARPVKRLIQKEIVNELSKEIIGGKVSKEGIIEIDTRDGHLFFSRES